MVVLMGKARYQSGHCVHYRGLKLATSTFVLSLLDADLYSHIQQAFRIDYILCSFWKPEPQFASYATLIRPRNLKTAANKI